MGAAAAALFAAATAFAALSFRPDHAAPAGAQIGLSDTQLVIRGEVADRYRQPGGLSDTQLVIRGEVADRYGR